MLGVAFYTDMSRVFIMHAYIYLNKYYSVVHHKIVFVPLKYFFQKSTTIPQTTVQLVLVKKCHVEG